VNIKFLCVFCKKKLTKAPIKFRSTGIAIIVDPIKAVVFRVVSDCVAVVAKWYVVIWTASSSRELLAL
jgi:hypothetical protein